MARYPELVRAELAMIAGKYSRLSSVDTIFIGGGTPTFLPDETVQELCIVLRDVSHFVPDYEWTVEANPESARTGILDTYIQAGVNRISLGIQSFHDTELAFLGRPHTADDARKAVESVSNSTLTSWSMDLIFGFTGQTLESWKATLAQALEYAPPHMSAYCLMIEPGSVFAQKPDGNWTADEELIDRQYRLLLDVMEDAGYVHYEVSNFARPGHECRHNMAYWKRQPYIGLGPSAHSFDGSRRWWNVRSVADYADAVQMERFPVEDEETLTEKACIREQIMLGLRLGEGIRWDDLSSTVVETLRKSAVSLVDNGILIQNDTGLRLSRQSWPVVDAVVRHFCAPF